MESDPILTPGQSASEAERTTLLVAYVLQVISPFTAFLASVISVVISYIKAAETQNEYIRSHHRYLIRTFWWTLILGFIFGLLCWIVIGIPLLIGLGIWWIYRMVRGFIAYSERRSMPL
ncbi:DUF4870 family protein [Solimonas marina]|uniref:Transmembrane protein n=1 Tax=Solimonas marina TaxID=2714601 RepID=A0A969WAA0_9GAMM|nr:DUF4870 domain-containing protein [Solimonas marina]NKF22888.1 hypothetical protein [Solimonas marina]